MESWDFENCDVKTVFGENFANSTNYATSGTYSLTTEGEVSAAKTFTYTQANVLAAESWTATGKYSTDTPQAAEFRIEISNGVTGRLNFPLNSSTVSLYSATSGPLDLEFTVEAGVWYNFTLTVNMTGITATINGETWTHPLAGSTVETVEYTLTFNNHLDSPYIDELAFSCDYTAPDPTAQTWGNTAGIPAWVPLLLMIGAAVAMLGFIIKAAINPEGEVGVISLIALVLTTVMIAYLLAVVLGAFT